MRALAWLLWVLTAFAAGALGRSLPMAWAGGGQLLLTVVDRDSRQPIAVRMHLSNAAGQPRKPDGVPFWHDHFVFAGQITLKLPVGQYTFQMEHGPEYLDRSGHFAIENHADDTKQVDMHRFIDMAAHGWWSGDLDVRRPVADMELLMSAEDLHLAEVVTWRNDRGDGTGRPPPKDPLVTFDGNRCCQVTAGVLARPGTELLLFNLPGPLKLAPAGPDYPPTTRFLAEARRQRELWVDLSRPYWWELPMLVAQGQIDSIQIAHGNVGRQTALCDEADGKPRDKSRYPVPMGNAQWSQDIYFRLLECGLRIPPTAGSGSGMSPNPVGYNRVYVHLDSMFDYRRWWQNLRAGQVFITNGPLMQPVVNGELPGHVFCGEKGQRLEFETGLTFSTRDPISYLELIKNGQVEHSVRFDDYAQGGRLPKLKFDRSGWFLVRAVTDLPKTYRFAMTGPYYVEIDVQRRVSKRAAQFFLDWVYERARQVKVDDPDQRREVHEYYVQARAFWQDLVSKANAQ